MIAMVALVGLSVPVLATPFIGADQCKDCHPKQYAQWAKTPHARASSRLSREQQRDPRCTSCHATSAPDGLLGVQCESCHGAGREYWPEPVMRDRKLARAVGLRSGGEPSVCYRCHTVDSALLRPFNVTEALKRIRHDGVIGE